MSEPRSSPPSSADGLLDVQRLLTRERISLDQVEPGRTCFLSHLGAQSKLSPAPWVAHRDLAYALALANLNPALRKSLARAVLLEHGREFGVGRLRLTPYASGLPLGGSSLVLEPRRRGSGPRCLYTWALGMQAVPVSCDWLLLRAQPEWALDPPPPPLRPSGLQTLAALGGRVLVLVENATAAIAVVQACAGKVTLASHPRFAPFLEGLEPRADVLVWPHDALDSANLRNLPILAAALIGATESVRDATRRWLASRDAARVGDYELVTASCPGRIDRPALARFWAACGRPRILLTGDPTWAAQGGRWLREVGAKVEVHGEATQLQLL